MKNLVEKINSGEIKNQQDLERFYSENVNDLSSRTNQKITIFSVIEDYKKAFALLKSKNIPLENQFHRNVFTQVLAKIKAIGITNWKTRIQEFILYRNYLIEEVGRKDKKAAESFNFMLSDAYIKNTDKETISLFYQAFSHYVETAVNLHQYTKATIEQNRRIASSCCTELKDKYPNTNVQNHIENVEAFLNSLIIEILEAKEYRRT